MYEIRERKSGAVIAQNVINLPTAYRIIEMWGRYDNGELSKKEYDIYMIKPEKVFEKITAAKARELYKKERFNNCDN